jgi:hypothetical protein
VWWAVWWAASRLTLLACWVFLICYPDPRVLGEAIRHTWAPPIDAGAVRDWASTLPDDPRRIEEAVLARVRYAVPWETDEVPWAVPDPGRALARGLGDCQARAVVLASVLAAKGIPFQLRASLDHLWVEYPEKPARALENASVVLWSRQVAAPRGGGVGLPGVPGVRGVPGAAVFRWPRMEWETTLRIEKAYFWDAAPGSRRALIGLGLLLLSWRSPCARRRRGGIPTRRRRG